MIKHKINRVLKEKNLNIYQLNKLINYHEGDLYRMINGKKSFSKLVIDSISPILEVSEEEFMGWIISDKYDVEVLELAYQVRNEYHHNKRKSILTDKINELLKEKGLSRTELSKIINYSQSGLNKMITNKMSFSKNVIQKVTIALNISENDILSWIVADKYNLLILRFAINSINNSQLELVE